MSENPKLVNLGGVALNLPKTPIVPDIPVDVSGKRGMSLSDAYDQGLMGPGTRAAGPIPTSSFYAGERYDETRPFTDFEESAANRQSTLSKWTNGTIKLGGTMTNAFLSGTVGLVYGAAASLRDQRFASLFDNEFNRGLDEMLGKQLEDIAPNYYTKRENEADWWEPDNILTANFWSDKLLKNIGYTIGSIAGGFGWSAIFKAMGAANGLVKAGQGLSTAEAVDAAITNAPKMSRFGAVSETLNSLSQKYVKNRAGQFFNQGDRITTSFMGTMGEASMESLQSTNEFRNKLIDEYIKTNGYRPEGEDLQEINDYAGKVGNYVWATNVTILTGTNYLQLPKILNSSRKFERQIINTIEKEGDVLSNWTTPSLTKGAKVLRGAKNIGGIIFSPSEAFEEGAQYATQKGVDAYFDKAYRNKQESTSYLDALGEIYNTGVYRTLNDKEGLESILIGGLSGGLMMAKGEIKEKGLFGAGGERGKNTAMALDVLNKTKIDSTLKDLANYSAIAIGSQQERVEALMENDKLKEKDAEKDYALSYLMPRIKYGKIEAVRQELDYYRYQANNVQGFEELKAQGIANPNDTAQSFIARLDTLQRDAESINKIYDNINDKYSNVRDKDGKRVYNDLVVDKLVYATSKISDYDGRLVSLGNQLTAAGVDISFIRPNISDKEAITKGLEKSLADIASMDVVDEVKDDLTTDLYHYTQMALLRKNFIDEYNDIKTNPTKYEREEEPPVELDKSGEEEEDLEEAIEEKQTIKLLTKRGEKNVPIGVPLMVGKVIDYDDDGREVYRAPEIIILGENEDGTIKIQTAEGKIENIKKETLAKYNLGTKDAIDKSTNASLYYTHWNDVFNFNFGKDYGGIRPGRLSYNPETDDLFFVYKDAKGVVRERKVTRKDFEAQEGFTEPKLKADRTLIATTTAKEKAFNAFLSAEEKKKEAAKEEKERRKDTRLQIIKEVTDQTRETLESVRKKILDKKSQIEDINKELDELREVKAPEARGKREKALEAKYPELSRQTAKFNKVFRQTTNALIKLTNLKQSLEEEIESLTKDAEELEFNLSYMEDFASSIDELPTNTREFTKELREQIDWLKELSQETKDEISVLNNMLKDINSAIREVAKFLKSLVQKFDKDYPSYLKDSFDRMIKDGGILADIDVIQKYREDAKFIGDVEKEITFKEEEADKVKAEIVKLAERMSELNQQVRAKEAVIKKFEEIVQAYDRAKAEEEALLKNKELQEKFFGQQVQANATSGDEIEEPLTEEEQKKQQAALDEFFAAAPAEIAFAKTIVSSSSDRPSDARFNRFLSKLNKLPTEARNKLRRIFVAAGNEKAIGLEGIIKEHLRGEEFVEEDDQLIISLYVSEEEDGTYYVNEDGNKIKKEDGSFLMVGEPITDRSQLIWASMPRPTEKTDAGYARFNEKTPKKIVDAYIDAYKVWRGEVLRQEDSVFPPEPFLVSKGKTKKGKGKNYIVGTLVTKEELASNKPVVVVSTKGVISHNGVDVVAPAGRIYVQNDNILEPAYNRNLTDNEVDTVFEVLKEFVRKANATGVFDKELTRFLQGLLYFSDPYRKKDGVETKGKVGRNQMYFRNSRFYLGANEIEVPFTVDALTTRETEVKAFLKGTYNNVNTFHLNENLPFTEFVLNDVNELVKKEWKSYQEYLISNEGRTAEEVPLSTTVATPSNDIAGDTIYEPGSLYAYSLNLFEVAIAEDPQPIAEEKVEVEEEEQVLGGDPELSLTEEEYISRNNLDVNNPFDRTMIKAFRRRKADAIEEAKEEKVIEEKKPIQEQQVFPAKKLVSEKDKEGNEGFKKLGKVTLDELSGKKTAPDATPVKEQPTVKEEEPQKTSGFDLEEARKKAGDIAPSDDYGDLELRVAGAYDYTMANMEEEVEFIKKNSPFSVQIIDNLIAAGNGIFAWGSYKNAAITLSNLMETGTGYHEFFEGIYDVFLNDKEKNRIYNEFASRKGTFIDRETGKEINYSDATVKQAKEQMAEEFRAKKLFGENPPKSNTNFIVKFFEDLLKFIESLFTNNIKNLDDLFAKMDGGYYKNAPFKKAPTNEPQYRLRTIGTLDMASTSVVVKFVVGKVFNRLFNSGRADVIVNLDELRTFKAEQVYNSIYKDLQYYYLVDLPARLAEQGVTTAQYNTKYGPVIESVLGNWSQVKELSGEFLISFKILQDFAVDKESENTEYGSGNADSYLQDAFFYDGKKNAPASIKLLLATLDDCSYQLVKSKEIKISDLSKPAVKVVTTNKDETTALNKMIDYAKTYNFLMSKLVSANTLKEKEQIIKDMSKNYPNFVQLTKRLKIGETSISEAEWSLKIKLYNTFAKMSPVALINYLQADGTTTIGEANLRNAVDNLSNNWLATAKNNPELVSVVDNKFLFNISKIDMRTASTEEKFKFLNRLGVKFDKAQVENLIAEQSKVSGSEVKGPIDKLGEAINSIKIAAKGKNLNATSLRTLDIRGPIESIFEQFIKSANLEPENTFLNLNNQRVQQNIQTNAASRIINDINNATSIQDLYKRLPHLAGVYSQDSEFLSNILFSDDKRTNLMLAIKYIMGNVDVSEGKTMETAKINEADRLMQSITQNLAGNYSFLVPADSQTEFMVGMKNLYNGLTQDAKNKFWQYYQTEQSLPGKSKNRLFNFIEDGLTIKDKAKFEKQLEDFINYEVDSQMQTLSAASILTKKEEKGQIIYSWKGLYKNYIDGSSYKTNNLTEGQVREILTYRTVNFIANNTEIHKIFFGDPGAFEDPTKRYKSFLSPREQSLYDSQEYNSFANDNFNYAGDIKLTEKDPGYNWFKDSLKTVTVEDVFTETPDLPGYEKNNSTDGQAIAPLASMRQMLKKNGDRWSKTAEAQFQYDMAKDRLLMAEDGFYTYTSEALKKHDEALVKKGDPRMASFTPIKPVVSGFVGDQPVLDKYSIYGVTYSSVRNTALAKVYVRMLNEGIDYLIFESGRKVGAASQAVMDTIYDEQTQEVKTTLFSPEAIVNVPYKWFGIQVETQGSKDAQSFGTQIGKLGTVNLMEMGKPVDFKGTEEEWINTPFEERRKISKVFDLVAKERELREQMIINGYEELLNKFGFVPGTSAVDLESVLKVIKDETTRRGLNENLREALQIDPETKTFNIPLEALNNYESIKNILFSYVDKFIASPKVSGGEKIQVSGVGWEIDGKRIKKSTFKNKKGETRTVYTHAGLKFYTKDAPYIEVYLPNWFAQKLLKAGIDPDKFDLSTLDEEILRGIGFRIPTQELNSAEVFKVKGFLPASMGNTIVVPEAITTKAGSDFDVDKLNTYLKNVYIDENGKVKAVPYVETKVEAARLFGPMFDAMLKRSIKAVNKEMDFTNKLLEAAQSISLGLGEPKRVTKFIEKNADLINKIYDKANTPEEEREVEQEIINVILSLGDRKDDLTNEELQAEFRERHIDKMFRQSIENEYFRTLDAIFTLPENFDRLVAPNSSKELKDLRDELVKISQDEFGEGQYKTILSPSFVNRVRTNFLLGKGGVGISSTNQTNAALAQKTVIYIDPARVKNLSNANESKYIQDASVKLPHNTAKVAGKTYATISGRIDKVGRYISDKISQYTNGFVDVAKDAFIVMIGVNKANASTFLLLERLGVPTDVVVYFMNQPIIREFHKILNKKKKTYMFNDEAIMEAMAMFPSKVPVKDYGLKDPNNSKELASILKANIKEYYGDGKTALSEKGRAMQSFILAEYLKYSVMSNNLFRFGQGVNYDTANFSNPWLVEKKLFKTEEANLDNIFSSVKDVLDKTFMGVMQRAVVSSTQVISDSLFKFLNGTNKEYLRNSTRDLAKSFLSDVDFVRAARKLEQSFIGYLAQISGNITSRITELAIDPKTAVAIQLQKVKNQLLTSPNSTLANNLVLSKLIAEDIEEAIDARVVKLFDKSSDVFTQNALIESMLELKNNPATQELYKNLVTLGFIQSGISTSPISFLDVVPLEDYKELILPAIDKGLLDKNLLKEFDKLGAFQRNNWRDQDIVPRIEEKFVDDMFSGEKIVINRFYNANLSKLVEKSKTDKFFAYTVFKDMPAAKSRYITVRIGSGKAAKIALLRRVDLNENTPYETTDKKGRTYNVFTLVNAWGNGIKGQEYYSYPTKSVYNNGTIQTSVELSNNEILDALEGNIGSEVVSKPTSATGVPTTSPTTAIVTAAPTAAKTINIYAGTGENAELSNFAVRPFTIGGETYDSVEQYFQLQKFQIAGVLKFDYNSPNAQSIANKINEVADKIVDTKNGAELKRLGNTKIAGTTFDEQFWNRQGKIAMKEAMMASFSQNPESLKRLLDTGNATLTHTQDTTPWGKEFPRLLMEVREELKSKEQGDMFESLTEFTPERKAEIISNFAAKHEFTADEARAYINQALAKNRQDVINKLKECY